LKFFFRDGRIALVVALAFLLGCILLRQVALAFGKGLGVQIVDEGLYIVGWVAILWRSRNLSLRLAADLAPLSVVCQARYGAGRRAHDLSRGEGGMRLCDSPAGEFRPSSDRPDL